MVTYSTQKDLAHMIMLKLPLVWLIWALIIETKEQLTSLVVNRFTSIMVSIAIVEVRLTRNQISIHHKLLRGQFTKTMGLAETVIFPAITVV